ESYSALQDECLFHAAVSHERLRRFKPAVERYARISATSRPYFEARLSMARLLRRGGDLRGAMEALSPVAFEPQAPIKPEARATALLLYADVARQAGAYNPEHRALLSLWSSFPESPQAGVAAKRLSGLPISPKARVARAEAFLALHRNADAIETARFVLKKLTLPDPLACRAQFAVGKALRKERRHAMAIGTLLPVVQRCVDPEVRARALFVLGYSLSVLAPPVALETYDGLVREYPRDALAPQSQFYAAEMAARTGVIEEAKGRLEKLVSAYPDSPFAAEALFKLAWFERKQGNVGKALAALDRTWSLPKSVASLDQRARARYWKARWLEGPGHEDAQLRELEAVVIDGPTSYYGLLARARMELRDPARLVRVLAAFQRDGAERWPLDAGPLLSSPRFLAGVELLRLGLPNAGKELLSIDVSSLPDDSARLLFQVLKTSGFDREARIVVARLLRASGGGMSGLADGGAWGLAYPPVFQDVIEASSAQAGIDPDLLWALVREESAFNPRARSSTGALGLAQLMPRTATVVARSLKLGRASRGALLDPRRNTRLGAEYLATLLRQFDRNVVFAVASYNAGPEAVERWRRDRPTAELDAWVEDIPVEETRGYVKRVLGSYGAYGLLRGSDNAEAARTQLRALLAESREHAASSSVGVAR
ncbi:MAG TPA: transglycosylase SLT domain-containing protein, partial [Myxococcaceae bacterium]|nr:transglycosylase SLT domain-containing protein [Myxococcaceae bacterium]